MKERKHQAEFGTKNFECTQIQFEWIVSSVPGLISTLPPVWESGYPVLIKRQWMCTTKYLPLFPNLYHSFSFMSTKNNQHAYYKVVDEAA